MSKKITNNSTVGALAPRPAVNGAYYRGKHGELKDPVMVSGSESQLPWVILDGLRSSDRQLLPARPYQPRRHDPLALAKLTGPNTVYISHEDDVAKNALRHLPFILDSEASFLEHVNTKDPLFVDIEVGGTLPRFKNSIGRMHHPVVTSMMQEKFAIKPTSVQPKAGSPLLTAMLKRI